MTRLSSAVFLPASLFALALTGCNAGLPTQVAPAAKTASAGGGVHGGNQPVSGATIQVYSPGTTGYGSSATPLNTGTPILTDVNGYFSLASLTCPSGPTGRDRLYVTATGGNPGFAGSVNNDALFLMTVIDNCQTLTTSSFLSISEVSTVASIYALAQFMSPTRGSIGAYGSSMTGLNNAFDLAITLFNPATGQAYATTPNGNGIVPQTTINSLANIITPCVNSTDHTSSACAALFPLTTNVAASNTGLAALQIALHPGTNVGNLYSLAFANAPFQPALSAAPNDLTLSVSYHTGAGVPTSMALDASGNVWIADYETGGSTSRLFKVIPAGMTFSYSSNSNGIKYLAADRNSNIWAIDPDDSVIKEYNSSGTGIYVSPSIPGQAIAIDSGNNPWVANSGSSNVTEFNVISGDTASFGGTSLSTPSSIAFDNSGNAWIANSGVSSLSKFNAAGVSAGPYTGGGLNHPGGVAIDASGNVYAGNTSGGALSEFNSAGTAANSSGYTFSSFGTSSNVAVDGSNHLWSAGTNNLLSEVYNGALVSPSTGYMSAGVNAANGIAVDPSGNVWVLDSVHISENGTFVNLTNFVGIATPAVTPLAAAVHNGQIGAVAGTPIPVAVASGALPYYTIGSAYSATLQASGGSGAYTWTSSALPTGLSLSSAGVLSGIPTGTAASVTFTVSDTALPSNTASRTITLSPTTSLPSGTNTANLTGPYAVLFKGFKASSSSTTGATSGFAAIGSFTFDGAGGVTGVYEYNGYDATAFNQTVSGTYTVGADLRGTIILTTSSGSILSYAPTQIAFSVANSYNTLYLTDFESTGGARPFASGIAKRQTAAQFTTATLNQPFAFGFDGETACATSCSTGSSPYYGPMSMAGRIRFTSATSGSAIFDIAALNNSYSQISAAPTYTAPAVATGRGTITINASSTTFSLNPTLLIYYVVNSTEMFVMSVNAHAVANLFSGDMVVQTQTFSATSSSNNGVFSGNYVISSSGTVGGNGTTNYPVATDNAIVLATSGGAGTTLVTQDENSAGLITSEYDLLQGGSGLPYSIDQNGRMTLTGPSISFYLASGSKGFGTQLPSTNNQGAPGLINLEKQSGTLSCSAVTGAFSFGSRPPTIPQSVSSGVVTFTSGTGSATVDSSQTSGALTSGAANTYTCASDSKTPTLGRLLFTDSTGQTSVGYIVSSNELLLLNNTANKTKEGVTVLTAQ